MNYLTIIIILILLFCVFQLGAQDKKEGFEDTVPSNNLQCPSGYEIYGNYTTDCRKIKTVVNSPSCIDTKKVKFGYGTMDSSGKITVSTSNQIEKCFTSKEVEADVISLCPDGYDFISSGHCVKNTRRGTTIFKNTEACPTGRSRVYEECVDFEYKNKECASGLINPWKNQNKTLKDTGKCCPDAYPYYKTNLNDSKCRKVWS
jgi:hypothetical protein